MSDGWTLPANGRVELNLNCQLQELSGIQWELNSHGIGWVSFASRQRSQCFPKWLALAAFNGSSILSIRRISITGRWTEKPVFLQIGVSRSIQQEHNNHSIGQVSLCKQMDKKDNVFLRRTERAKLVARKAVASFDRSSIFTSRTGKHRQQLKENIFTQPGKLQQHLIGVQYLRHRTGKPCRQSDGKTRFARSGASHSIRQDFNTLGIRQVSLAGSLTERKGLINQEALAACNWISVLSASNG